MSNLIVADIGENTIQNAWVLEIGGTLLLHLFKNNYTPVAASVLGSFTEADYSGYADQSPSFGSSVTTGGKGTITDSSARVFTVTAGGVSNTIYGYYVTANPGGGGEVLLWAQRFDASQSMSSIGDSISITLVFTLDSEF